jgi:hypothetical protein
MKLVTNCDKLCVNFYTVSLSELFKIYKDTIANRMKTIKDGITTRNTKQDLV